MNADASLAVSVVVPARNEAANIGGLLDALADQTWVPDEVIVVDAGSTDRTRVVADERKGRFRRFQIVDCPGAYPGRARNRGAQAARNERLVFVDCGLALEPDCLERLMEEAPDGEAAYGWVVPRTDSLFTECAAIAYLQPVTRRGEAVDRPCVQVFTIDRERFHQTGGFPGELRSAEDLVFLDRLVRAGTPVHFAMSARARWELCPGFVSTFRRFRTYSLHNLRAGLAGQWQRPLALYYAAWAGIASIIVTLTSQWIAVPVSLAAFLALRAARRLWRHRDDAAGRTRRRCVQLPLVMAILFVVDLATAAGTLDYLVRSTGPRAPSELAADEPRSTDA